MRQDVLEKEENILKTEEMTKAKEVAQAEVNSDISKDVVQAGANDNISKEVVQAEVNDNISKDVVQAGANDNISKEVAQAEVNSDISKDVVQAEVNDNISKDVVQAGVKLIKKYKTPPIPEGFKKIIGSWKKGFVIQSLYGCGQFVWVPVGYLPKNGTIDGTDFTKKFGRRNYDNCETFATEFAEEMDADFNKQRKSIIKYGGFYVSRFNISRNCRVMPAAVSNALPILTKFYEEAKGLASVVFSRKDVKSHLLYGCEYDCMLEWIMKSNDMKLEDITVPDVCAPVELVDKSRLINRVFDFSTNVPEWTQENDSKFEHVVRKGFKRLRASQCENIGFRVALWLK